QNADAPILAGRLEGELLVARDDDGAGNGRQIARLPALLVILHELVDLAADDLALVRLLARRDPPLEEIPVHLRRRGARLLLAAADRRLRRVSVAQDLEPNQFVDIARRQRSMVELHAELLHPNRGNVDHRWIPKPGRPGGWGRDLPDRNSEFYRSNAKHLNGFFALVHES